MAFATNQFRLVIVGEHTLFGKALSYLLSLDAGVTALEDLKRFDVEALVAAKAEMVLIDLDGINEEIEYKMMHLRRLLPAARIVLLSSLGGMERSPRRLALDADGVLLKDILPSELLRQLKAIAGGERIVDPRLRTTRTPGAGGREAADLSMRETDVIRLIAQGLSNKEISSRLSLSEKTVKNHISRIFSKLHINARSQAAVHAIKNGLA
jgi:DNA-binding NarL/FixJ family response regulator